MHDWVHASEYYNKFFSWRLDFKVNDYLNFFSTTNFSYQYLPEAKAYLETSRTSTMELFANFFFKVYKKTPVPESLFKKVTNRFLSSVFSCKFAEYFRTIFPKKRAGSIFFNFTERNDSYRSVFWWILRGT